MGELRRAAASFAVALLLAGMSVVFWHVGEIFAVVAVLPAALSLFLLYNTIHSLLASRNPPTTLKLDAQRLRRGEPLTGVIRQQGPIVTESLRANLVCERSDRSFVRGKSRSRLVTFPCQLNFFDSGRFNLGRIDWRDFPFTVTAPAEAEPTTDTVELQVQWRIEIWGKVDGRADFMRPFDVVVV